MDKKKDLPNLDVEFYGPLVLELGRYLQRDLAMAKELLRIVKGYEGEEAARQCVLRMKEAILWMEEVSAEDVLPVRDNL